MADENTQVEAPLFPTARPVFPEAAGKPVPVTLPVRNENGDLVTPSFGTVSNEMPPKDVTDAVMLLTEVCKEWTPTPLPKPDPGAPPQMPIAHNQSYVLHHNVCSLATNPASLDDQIENVFLGGMGAAVALIIGVWLVLRAGNWLRKKIFRRKEDSALVLKHRLDAEGARQAPGAAQ